MSTNTETIDWQCQLCTFLNKSTTKKCSMCCIDRGVTLQNIDDNQNLLQVDGSSDFMKLRNTYTNYLELAELEGTDLITCMDHYDCQICLFTCSPGDGVTLKDCLHSFCRECLAQAVEHSTESEIRCPYRDEEYLCNSILQEREIKALVSTEVYEKYLARSVTEAEQKIHDAFHCQTANCRGWCIPDETVEIFRCPICLQENCVRCKAIHPRVSCDQYRLSMNLSECDRASATHMKELLEKKEAMNCPGCQIMITKTQGCDGMVCVVCKTEICWATRGPRWGPKGKGDLTGGCRCNVNGRKCHPQCDITRRRRKHRNLPCTDCVVEADIPASAHFLAYAGSSSALRKF